MQQWQKEHIRSSIVYLLKTIDCNDQFITALETSGMIGVTDRMDLVSQSVIRFGKQYLLAYILIVS